MKDQAYIVSLLEQALAAAKDPHPDPERGAERVWERTAAALQRIEHNLASAVIGLPVLGIVQHTDGAAEQRGPYSLLGKVQVHQGRENTWLDHLLYHCPKTGLWSRDPDSFAVRMRRVEG